MFKDTRDSAIIEVLEALEGGATEAQLNVANVSLNSIDIQIANQATATKQDTGNSSLSSIDTKVATSAKQDTGNTSLSSIDTKLSSQSTAANQTTGNSSLSSIDTKLSSQATGAKQDTGNTSLSSIDTKAGNIVTSVQLIDDAINAADTALSKGVPIMGQFDDVSTATVTENNVSPVRITTSRGLHANLRNAAGTEIATASTPARVDPTGTTTQPVSAPTLTKGTQGANGWSTQDLKDAGRTALSFYAIAAAAGSTGTETAITLTKSSGTGATSSAASFVVTNGKRFRITHISVATRQNATATAQTTTFNLRINTGGAVTTSSTPVVFSARSASAALASAWDRYTLPLPDGYEILGDGTLQFGITANATYVTNAPTWDVNILGFEY